MQAHADLKKIEQTKIEQKWPKTPPALSEAQLVAREKYMKLWHEELPKKYGIIEKFNHGFSARSHFPSGIKTLEIGAGIGGHLPYEDLSRQDYYCVEYREEFCVELRKHLPAERVLCANVEKQLPFADGSFDRILAIHVLEHLRNLPPAVKEIKRLLKSDGTFEIVIPCEGGMAHTFARKISAQRLFEKNFKMDFTPIHKNEHVNSFSEIMELLKFHFVIHESSYFPLLIPVHTLNLAAGFRLKVRH